MKETLSKTKTDYHRALLEETLEKVTDPQKGFKTASTCDTVSQEEDHDRIFNAYQLEAESFSSPSTDEHTVGCICKAAGHLKPLIESVTYHSADISEELEVICGFLLYHIATLLKRNNIKLGDTAKSNIKNLRYISGGPGRRTL